MIKTQAIQPNWMHMSILFLKGYYSFHRHEIHLDSMVNVPFKEGYLVLKLEGYKR